MDECSDGTEIASFNSNRNSSNTALTKVYFDPTVTNAGTKIQDVYVGDAGSPRTSSNERATRENELILKTNEQYLIKFTPDANDTLAEISLNWYE